MSYKRILCAIDVRDPSDEVVKHARTLAETFDAELEVVYVRRSQEVAARLFGDPGKRARSETLLKELVATRFQGLKAHGHLLQGDAAKAIVQTSSDLGCDLIIMGSHGRLGLGKLINGSVADVVIRHSALPVMTIAPARDPNELRIPDPMPNF